MNKKPIVNFSIDSFSKSNLIPNLKVLYESLDLFPSKKILYLKDEELLKTNLSFAERLKNIKDLFYPPSLNEQKQENEMKLFFEQGQILAIPFPKDDLIINEYINNWKQQGKITDDEIKKMKDGYIFWDLKIKELDENEIRYEHGILNWHEISDKKHIQRLQSLNKLDRNKYLTNYVEKLNFSQENNNRLTRSVPILGEENASANKTIPIRFSFQLNFQGFSGFLIDGKQKDENIGQILLNYRTNGNYKDKKDVYLYLARLQKGTSNKEWYSGKLKLQIVDQISKFFGFKGNYLIDASEWKGDEKVNLSLMMLYQIGKTYYEKYGYNLGYYSRKEKKVELIEDILRKEIERKRLWLSEMSVQMFFNLMDKQVQFYREIIDNSVWIRPKDKMFFHFQLNILRDHMDQMKVLFKSLEIKFEGILSKMDETFYSSFFLSLKETFSRLKNSASPYLHLIDHLLEYKDRHLKKNEKLLEEDMKKLDYLTKVRNQEWKLIEIYESFFRYQKLGFIFEEVFPIFWWKIFPEDVLLNEDEDEDENENENENEDENIINIQNNKDEIILNGENYNE